MGERKLLLRRRLAAFARKFVSEARKAFPERQKIYSKRGKKSTFVSCCFSAIPKGEKYKAYILKYKALVLK